MRTVRPVTQSIQHLYCIQKPTSTKLMEQALEEEDVSDRTDESMRDDDPESDEDDDMVDDRDVEDSLAGSGSKKRPTYKDARYSLGGKITAVNKKIAKGGKRPRIVGDAIQSDLTGAINEFISKGCMKFSSFRDVWQSRKLSLLHHAVPSRFDGRVFLQQAFSVALDLAKEEPLPSAKVAGAAPTSRSASASAARSAPAIPKLYAYKTGPGSLPFQIGALFAIYSLHGTQIFRSRVPIRLSAQDMLALMQLRRSLKSAGPLASDALAVLARLVLGCDGGCGALQPAVYSGPDTILYVDSRLQYTKTTRSNKKVLASQKEEIETEKVMAAEAKAAASRAAARARGGDAVSRTKTADAARSLLGLAQRLSSSYAAYEKALEYTRVGGAHASRNDNQEIVDGGGNPSINRRSKLLREVERFVERGIPDVPAANIHGLELLPRSSPSTATVNPSRKAPWTLSMRFPELPDLPRMSGVSQVEKAKSSNNAGARATDCAEGAQVTEEISGRGEVSINGRRERPPGSGTGGNVGNGTSLRTIRRIGVRDHLRLVEKSLQEAEEQDKNNEGATAENREGGASGIDTSAEWRGGGLSTSRTNSELNGSSASGGVLKLPGGLGNVPRIRGPGSSTEKTAGGDESGDGRSIPGASAGVGVAKLPGGLGNVSRVRGAGGSAEESAGHDESNVGRHTLGDSSVSIGAGGAVKLPGGLGNRDRKGKGKSQDQNDRQGTVGVDGVQRSAARDGSRVRGKRKPSGLAAECYDGHAPGEGESGTFPHKRGSFSEGGVGEIAASVATSADASTADPLTGSRQPTTRTPGNVPCNKKTKRSHRGGGRLNVNADVDELSTPLPLNVRRNSLPAEGSSETSREQGRGCGRPPRSTCLSTGMTTGYDSRRIVQGKGNASNPAAANGSPAGDAESPSSKDQEKGQGNREDVDGSGDDPRIASLFRFAAELSSSPSVSSGGSTITKKTQEAHKRKRTVAVSRPDTPATSLCATRRDESQTRVDASTQLQSTNNSPGLAAIASAKKTKLTDYSTPSSAAERDATRTNNTGEITVDMRAGETSSDSASDDGDDVEQPSSTKGTALGYGGPRKDCDTSGQGSDVGADKNVAGTVKQGAKGATTTDCRGEEQLQQVRNKGPPQVKVSNTDDDSHPAHVPKDIRAKAPEVKAIAATTTPDGAGSQTQNMGETSSDSDGGEDQD